MKNNKSVKIHKYTLLEVCYLLKKVFLILKRYQKIILKILLHHAEVVDMTEEERFLEIYVLIKYKFIVGSKNLKQR